jgi:hypothetical protein
VAHDGGVTYDHLMYRCVDKIREKKKKLEDSIEVLNRSLLESKADRRENEREQKLVCFCINLTRCTTVDRQMC